MAVSRYIHLNAVGAGIVERPGDYRWSSYGAYCKGKEVGAVKCERVLEYFSGPRKRRLAGYREFVEGKLAGGKIKALPVLKQVFIGDEEFAEQARRKAAKVSDSEKVYGLNRVVQAVCKVSRMAAEQIRRPGQSPAVKSAREIICYLARRHGDVGLRELTRFLRVKELSTGSHGLRRAEQRLSKEPEFRGQVERVLKTLSPSSSNTLEPLRVLRHSPKLEKLPSPISFRGPSGNSRRFCFVFAIHTTARRIGPSRTFKSHPFDMYSKFTINTNNGTPIGMNLHGFQRGKIVSSDLQRKRGTNHFTTTRRKI